MRRVVFAFWVVAAVGAAAPTATAHALLRASDPADGAVLQRAPSMVTLEFTERPDPALSEIGVIDVEGASYERGVAEAAADDPSSLRVELAPLPDGVYTVTWRAYSTVDGHVTGGAFAFGVRVDPGDVVPAGVPVEMTPPVSGVEVVGRLGLYIGLALVVGAAWVGVFAFQPVPGVAVRVAWAGVGLTAGGVVLFAHAQWQASGASLGAFGGTSIGRAIVWRCIAVAAGIALLVVASRSAEARPALLLAGGAAAAAMGVHVNAGHAAAGANPALTVPMQWLHFLAVGVWVGGLTALMAGVRGIPTDDKTRAVRRFSTVAAPALAVLAATGLWRAFDEVGSWSQLWEAGYGRVIVAKSVLLLVLIGLAARNRYASLPRISQDLRGLRRISWAELGVAGVVLAATGLMASLIPAGSALPADPGAAVAEGADRGTTVRVSLEAVPGFAGANTFSVAVRDYDTDEPVDADRVAVRFVPTGDVEVQETFLELAPAASGTWEGRGSNLAVNGIWRVAVLVQRGVDSVEVQLTLATRCRTVPIATPGQPTLHDVTLGEDRSVQGYVDPGETGHNETHFTFFGADGDELPITGDVRITALGPQGDPVDLEVRRFSPGHHIGGGELETGRWRFEVSARQADGERLAACFEEEIR